MPKVNPPRIGKCTVCLAKDVKIHRGECEECTAALAAHRYYTAPRDAVPAEKPVYRVAAMKR